MRNAILLMMCVALVCVLWMNLSPATSEAQSSNPSEWSNVKRFDEVFKTAATHDIIAGVDNRRFRILWIFVRSKSSTANTIYFSEEGVSDTVLGTNSTDVETLDELGISGKAGWSVDYPGGVYETTTEGTAFQITLSEAQDVSVVGAYVEVY